MQPLIKAEHVSKKFCRSLKRSLWYGIQDVAHSLNPWSREQQQAELEQKTTAASLRRDEFWALQDINFEVHRGECLGLIGHNGAGKSTLLKILNGLIRPDRGRITMRGRVAALIELNAGFNNLLTGRENIYSQAALLGFSREEIRQKFDDIVAFSEMEQFLDMPVQNYSSGMKVKLGFAVSTQLEPDILLIDEVLAVGDLGFRYKCLNRIGDLLKKSAVIFVSHSMTQVMRVSSQIMMLNQGRVHYDGRNVSAGLESYYALFGDGGMTSAGSQEVRFEAMFAATQLGEECSLGGQLAISNHDQLTFRMSIVSKSADIQRAVVQVLFWNHEMIPVLDVTGGSDYGFVLELGYPRTEVEVALPALPLNAGRYSVSLILTAPGLEKVYCQIDQAMKLLVSGGSPASGAGCVVTGNWKKLNQKLSLTSLRLLSQRDLSGEKLTVADTSLFDELAPEDIAIDCGANVGKITAEFARRGAVVHAFEPDPAAFAELQRQFGTNPKIRLYQAAVAAADGKMPLYFRSERATDAVLYSVGSTLFREKTDVLKDAFCEVEVRRLADFLRQFQRIRILKMDIEGAECEVLEDLLKEQLLDRIDLVLVETHEEWIPETIPRLQKIREQLQNGGYTNVFLNWI
jgi:lipopolysaccharide transport system ATP-binding protein